MSLTDDRLLAAARFPITDVGAWMDALPTEVRLPLRTLGELLIGSSTAHDSTPTADQFTAACLNVNSCGQLINEERGLTPVASLTTALALGSWIEEHGDACVVGPADWRNPPSWTQTEINGEQYRHPQCLRAYFPPGTLLPDSGCVIGIEVRENYSKTAEVSVFVVPEHQDSARAILDMLNKRADALNPYRGRVVRATYNQGLVLSVVDLPLTLTRDTVIVDAKVWTEIDLGVSAVRDRHELLDAHGLGVRRGVLLCGPPGTGKSALSAVVANELVGEFTVIFVEAQAGARLLTAVVEEAQRLAPALIVLEDVDLWCRDREAGGSAGLSELLVAMDIRPSARILTLASTNDVATLDKAAIRTGRFDSIVEVGYPSRRDAARILAALIADVPGGSGVDTTAVADSLPDHTSGSDLREIVRRAVLVDSEGTIRTETLLAEVGSGRYRAVVPAAGMYL